MSRAGIITSRALDAAVAAAKPGVSTAELNKVFERSLEDRAESRTFMVIMTTLQVSAPL